MVFGANQLFGQFGALPNVSGLIILGLGWTIIWTRLDVPPPSNATDRFGIGIFIITETEKGRLRLENDLLKRMNETIQDQGLGAYFELVLASNAQAKKYSPLIARHRTVLASPDPTIFVKDHKRFARFNKKAKCHFFTWGVLTERRDAELGGKTALILKSDALILHSELAPFRKKALEEQFKWIKEFKINEEAEYQGLQFTADELILVADLVVGSAAAMVGNALPALEIHQKLFDHLNRVAETPSRKAIKKHVTAMIVDEFAVLASVAYMSQNDAALAKDYLQRAFALKPNHHNCLVLLARIQFEHDNDAAAALTTSHRLKPVADGIGIWRYNIAFLEMFAGNHKSAWKLYEEIFRTTYAGESSTVSQVIDFNENQAKKGFVPSLFIIGILFARKLANLPEGLLFLESFLAEAPTDGSMYFLRTQATVLRREMLKEMKLDENDQPF